jgi:hypothetical protein
MITTADFLGYIVISFLISYIIGYIINGLFSLFNHIR